MARIGKIARLPRAVRAQLNSRLQDGHDGKQILQWLNSLPEVSELLTRRFGGRPLTKQNLSRWRLGGYQEWLLREDILEHAAGRRPEAALPGLSAPDPSGGAGAAIKANQG